MQGEGCVNDIMKGLEIVSSYEPDVIAIIRGGGSTSDLISFDSENLVRPLLNLQFQYLPELDMKSIKVFQI